MTQVRPFNQSQAGTTPNWCLANVIKGYGIAPKYPDAWTAWLNTEQHSGEAPAGLDVPVFFSYFATIDGEYKNWGHIGVRLANGQFWSDGKIYNSIGAYTANHSPKYVGWGESINDVMVIQQGDDEMSQATVDDVYKKLDQINKDVAQTNKNLDSLYKIVDQEQKNLAKLYEIVDNIQKKLT